MNSSIPKQFLLLAGRPILLHCLNAFNEADPQIEIVIALPETFIEEWKRLCSVHGVKVKHKVVAGGETRFQSVKNALSLIPDKCFVAVHDGVRPLVTPELINICYDAAALMGNAVPVIPVNDSLRSVDGSENRPEERRRIRIVQTPQVFKAMNLIKAYEQTYDITFTDDATVIERMGEKIHLIPGNPGNLKITCLDDIRIAESLLLANK